MLVRRLLEGGGVTLRLEDRVICACVRYSRSASNTVEAEGSCARIHHLPFVK